MPTRSGMRSHLRRRLQERTPAQWSESVLNEYLNYGYHFAQEEVESHKPEAFAHYRDATNIIKDQYEYPLPVNCKTPVMLYMKTSANAEYEIIEQRPQHTVRKILAGEEAGEGRVVWALEGSNIILSEKPSAAVTEGLLLIYVPVLTMGSDSDTPEVTPNLHYAIVLMAQLIALGDTANVTDKEATKKDLEFYIARLPRHYQRSLAQVGGNPPATVSPRAKLGGSVEGVTRYSRYNDEDY